MPILDAEQICQRLTNVGADRPQVSLSDNPFPTAWIEFVSGPIKPKPGYTIRDEHAIEIIAFDKPVSDYELDLTSCCMPWKSNPRDELRGHQAQLRCTYRGRSPDRTEHLVALYKVAYCFAEQEMMGIWDEYINVCHPTCVATTLFDLPFRLVDQCRESPLLGLWNNFLRFDRPSGGTWFYTKGNYRFGIRDFAYLGQPSDQVTAYHLFVELFEQIFQSRIPLDVGDTARLELGNWVSMSGLLEYFEVLGSPLGTLVVQLHEESQESDNPLDLWNI